MSSESQPHVVYSKDYPVTGVAWVCPDYKSAYERWCAQHGYKTPYLIAVIGRVIDPSTPIVDVNE